ncbi:hypothetical protein RHSIM_Rhsim09G0126600 [Rhododendron simsii]|uniref:ATPase AAA-type core domain-containing protein n=1 Tax=Rhododendron simsii TaxID=118357 RepID=A0A834GCS3_RHOSS|nr:hypothetical protein RHSIM_Rhsim09G0126600 [Rhododendron simsii]
MEASSSNSTTTGDGGEFRAEEAWPRGLLLYGPPGTGKTSLVRAVVRECGAHLIVISPHSVHRAHAGESERILRDAFAEASSHAKLGKPSVIFIDEIDALCPRRDSRHVTTD